MEDRLTERTSSLSILEFVTMHLQSLSQTSRMYVCRQLDPKKLSSISRCP
jgi:hypothetical protein